MRQSFRLEFCARSIKSKSKRAARKFGQSAERQAMKTMNTEFDPKNPAFNKLEDAQARYLSNETRGVYKPSNFQEGKRPMERGRTAVFQARLVLLVMINLAQLWILSATVEAALAREYKQLLPLVIGSGVCWLIALTVFLWWKPTSRRHTSAGYMSGK